MWIRFILTAFFSITALTLFSYQGFEIFNAFMDFFRKDSQPEAKVQSLEIIGNQEISGRRVKKDLHFCFHQCGKICNVDFFLKPRDGVTV